MTPPQRTSPGAGAWLGTVTFGSWGTADHRECEAVVLTALEHGVTTIDTAASYGDGEAEVIVGEVLKGRRDQVAVATKYGYDNATGGARPLTAAAVVASVEASLQRLGTDRVEVLFIHRLDPSTPLDEIVAGVGRLVAEGKVLAAGTSMATPAQLSALALAAREAGVPAFGWEQAPYSAFVRHVEAEVVPACQELGVSIAGFAPLNGGWLGGRYRKGAPPPSDSRAARWPIRRERFEFERDEIQRKLELAEALGDLAAASGRTLPQLAVGFARSHPGIGSIILGARTAPQLLPLLAPEAGPLEPSLRDAVDELIPPGSTIDPLDVAGYAP